MSKKRRPVTDKTQRETNRYHPKSTTGDFVVAFSGYRTLESPPVAFQWETNERYETAVELDRFDYSNFYVYRACSVMYKEQIVFFGGYQHPTRVVKLNGCALEDVPVQLPVNMEYHSCVASMGQVWLCGSKQSPSDCITFDGTEFTQVASTLIGHQEGAMVEFRGSGVSADIKSPVIIGGCYLDCRYSSSNVEKWYDDFGGFWQTLASVPTRSKEIQGHSAIATVDSIYVFGDLNYPASYQYDIDQNKWTEGPNLLSRRYGHRSIQVGELVYHVGGRDDTYIERWSANGSGQTSETVLPNYAYYPEVYLLPYQIIKQCIS